MFNKKMKIDAETWDLWFMNEWIVTQCRSYDKVLPKLKELCPERFSEKENILISYYYDLYSFLCHIAGEKSKEESAFIDLFIKKCGLVAYRTRKPILLDEAYIPVTFRNFIDIENLTLDRNLQLERPKMKNQTVESWSVFLLRTFAAFGYSMLISDNEFRPDELKRFTVLIKTYQSYIYKNLKRKDYGTSMRIVLSTESDREKNSIVIEDKPPVDEAKAEELEKLKKKQENIEEKIDYLEQLDSLVGLEGVKEEVMNMINLIKVRSLREERGLKNVPVSYHMVFTGNPGTGKTTVARIMAGLFHEYGILSKGTLVETERSGLVGEYIGATALKVKKKIEEAEGGVLFIDEAYALAYSDSERDFGFEAIDALIKAMEDKRKDFIVIVAGYTKPMQKFIDSNPGLRSRFNKYIEFPDYNPGELMEMFRRLCKENSYELSSEAETALDQYFTGLYAVRDDHFGNGREVRNIFEKAISRQASRITKIESPTDEQIMMIEIDDII